jgi:DNA-binding NtrC family response regulator
MFNVFLAEILGPDVDLPETPFWLLDTISKLKFAGNVRELRNLAERVGVTVRQLGSWNAERVQAILNLSIARGLSQASAAEDGADANRMRFDIHERNRIIGALESHAWRRQATADALRMSRKALWEKMRKYHIGEDEASPS